MDNDWELTESPAGHKQWTAPALAGTVPDAHDPTITHAPMMSTADMAMKMDPIYGPISQRFRDNPEQLDDAFARAWYKLLHRDMGPTCNFLGPEVPREQTVAGSDPGRHRTQRRRRRNAQEPPSWHPASASPTSVRHGHRLRRSARATSAAAPTVAVSACRLRMSGKPTSRPSCAGCSRTRGCPVERSVSPYRWLT